MNADEGVSPVKEAMDAVAEHNARLNYMAKMMGIEPEQVASLLADKEAGALSPENAAVARKLKKEALEQKRKAAIGKRIPTRKATQVYIDGVPTPASNHVRLLALRAQRARMTVKDYCAAHGIDYPLETITAAELEEDHKVSQLDGGPQDLINDVVSSWS